MYNSLPAFQCRQFYTEHVNTYSFHGTVAKARDLTINMLNWQANSKLTVSNETHSRFIYLFKQCKTSVSIVYYAACICFKQDFMIWPCSPDSICLIHQSTGESIVSISLCGKWMITNNKLFRSKTSNHESRPYSVCESVTDVELFLITYEWPSCSFPAALLFIYHLFGHDNRSDTSLCFFFDYCTAQIKHIRDLC